MSRTGLDRIIRDSFQSNTNSDVAQEFDGSGARMSGARRMKNAKWVAIEKIRPDPAQPRKFFKKDSLEELALSIREHGIRQPIVVEYVEGKDFFRIVHGERRYRASKIAGLQEMPCIVQEKAERICRFAQQLVENIQREDLSPIDKARALLEYKEYLGRDRRWADVETSLGISEIMRKRFVALLKLPEEIQREIVIIGKRPSRNQITEKHARALLMLNNLPDKQAELFRTMKNSQDSITGDEAIEEAKCMNGARALRVFRVSYKSKEELINILEHKLEELKTAFNEGVP